MNILVICQYYYPEPFRIKDICEELVNRGHQVYVLTGEPNYPEGIIYQDYKKHDHKDEMINGVYVHRCRIIPRKTGPIYRILNYYSYAITSTMFVKSGQCLTKDKQTFDVVFVNQLSPVMMAYAGIAYKKKYKTPLVLYCLDLWPESLLAGGIKKESIIYRLFHLISKRIYQQNDTILVTSRLFSDYLHENFNIPVDIIKYLPQYAEKQFDSISPAKKDGIIDLLFAGNIGELQSVETILEAASFLTDYPIRFHILGSGSDYNRLFSKYNTLPNVIFYGRRELSEMPTFYSMADACLVTLVNNPVLSLTLPGKVQSYMASAKPIIAAINGETASVINDAHCGFVVPAEDACALSETIKHFYSLDYETIEKLGSNARDYYVKHFSEDAFFDSFIKEISN